MTERIEDLLRKTSVKIESSQGTLLGTGIILPSGDDLTILTCAHLLPDDDGARGQLRVSFGGEHRGIRKWWIPPDLSDPTDPPTRKDVALLTLESPLSRPTPIPWSSLFPDAGAMVWFHGFRQGQNNPETVRTRVTAWNDEQGGFMLQDAPAQGTSGGPVCLEQGSTLHIVGLMVGRFRDAAARGVFLPAASIGDTLPGGVRFTTVPEPDAGSRSNNNLQRPLTKGDATSFDFDLFLSHASEDKDEVRVFAHRLKAAGLTVWLDEEQMGPGVDPQESIPIALKASQHVVIWTTDAWLGKQWTKWELKLFAEAMGESRRIINVLRVPWDTERLGPYMVPFIAVPPDRDDDERLWLVICGLRGTSPGEQKSWAERGQGLTEGFDLVAAGVPLPTPGSISARLDDAYKRREKLIIDGEDTTKIDAELLELRREQRHGPTLHANEYLGNGRFRLIEMIGHGGFATVWKAYDKKERQLVAIKVLHGQFAPVESQRERLFRGARKMAELQHPHIVRVLVPEGEELGFYYYVMEYVAGGDLHRAIVEDQLDTTQALDVIEAIASALEVAHERGLVHRDVKPQNILLRSDGTPVLSDFDLVHARDTTGGTRTGAMGTVLYAAPEQNEDASRVDHRADIYSLGMTAVFCIHGDKLPGSAMYHRDKFFAGLRCDDGLRAVLQRAVALEPQKRFGTIGSFRSIYTRTREALRYDNSVDLAENKAESAQAEPTKRQTSKKTERRAAEEAARFEAERQAREALEREERLRVQEAEARARAEQEARLKEEPMRLDAQVKLSEEKAKPKWPLVVVPVLVLGLGLGALFVGQQIGEPMAIVAEETDAHQPLVAVVLTEGTSTGSEAEDLTGPNGITGTSSPEDGSSDGDSDGDSDGSSISNGGPESEDTAVFGQVLIDSKPSSAKIYIDGAPVGTTPFEGKLPVGAHEVRIVARGYRSYKRSFDVKESNRPLSVRLKSIPKPKPTGDADDLLAQARQIQHFHPYDALQAAEQSYEIKPSYDALWVIGRAACRLKDKSKANWVLKRLNGADKRYFKEICVSEGLNL